MPMRAQHDLALSATQKKALTFWHFTAAATCDNIQRYILWNHRDSSNPFDIQFNLFVHGESCFNVVSDRCGRPRCVCVALHAYGAQTHSLYLQFIVCAGEFAEAPYPNHSRTGFATNKSRRAIECGISEAANEQSLFNIAAIKLCILRVIV